MKQLLVVFALFVLPMAACGPHVSSAGGAECFPVEARRWLASEDPPQRAGPSELASANIYVDGSGSMTPYLKGASPAERPYHDLVDTLPSLLGVSTDRLSYRIFGKAIHPLASSRAPVLLAAETYACQGCDNQESRLDVVLTEIAAKSSDSVSLIVTDLWLKNSEVQTTGAVAYTRPLTQILKSGRSITIYGIDAPYGGRVEDLPINQGVAPAARQIVIAERRPLFLLVIGPKSHLDVIDRRMALSSSSLISSGIKSGAIKRALFSLEPQTKAEAEAMPLAGGASRLIAPHIFLRPREGLRVQQLRLSRSEALRAANGDVGGATPTWSGPKPGAISPGAVWAGPLQPKATYWRLKDDKAQCSPERDWRLEGAYTGGWRAADADGKPVFQLAPDEAASLLNKGEYLIVGEVRRTSLTIGNPATKWMRAWSFSPAEETGVLAKPPRLFPTLNLSETARLLESALAEAAEAKPNIVAGFVVAVKVE